MNSKLLTLLGFASKAGKLGFGMDATVGSLKAKKAHLIVAAADVSEKSRKEITYFAKESVPFIVIDCDMETLSKAVGKKCGIISVLDKGFKESILKIHSIN